MTDPRRPDTGGASSSSEAVTPANGSSSGFGFSTVQI